MKRYLTLLLTIFAVCFLLTACAAGDDDDDQGDPPATASDDDAIDDDMSDDDYTGEEVLKCNAKTCVDPKNGLEWQRTPDDQMWYDFQPASDHCKNLSLAGFNDWRLPTISEMRAVIRGCEHTDPDGYCEVTDECNDRGDCWNGFCAGCEEWQGPHQSGFYWPDEFEGKCCTYWSSTMSMDGPDIHWCMSFDTTYIVQARDGDMFSYARCVRDL